MYNKDITKNDNYQENFHKAELKERELMTKFFKKFNITNYSFTETEGFHPTDGEFTNREPIIFEVKCRNLSHDHYKDTTIEYKKVLNVLNRGLNENKRMFLFFFFNDGYVMLQELFQDIHYTTKIRECPKTTMGVTTKINKEMVDFKITKEKLKRYDC